MNQKTLESKRTETEKRYHVPGMPCYAHRKRNAIFLGNASVKHEMMKSLVCLMLNRWGDIKITPDIVKYMQFLDIAVEDAMKGFVKEKHEFITESCPNAYPNKRRDVVCLDNAMAFEIETTEKRAKRFEDDPEKEHIVVVRV